MAQPLVCTVTTPEKLVNEGEARLVVVPAVDGELGILPRHAPLMALLGVGELRINRPGGETERLFVNGGFLQVLDNRVNVLATEAELAGSIDVEAARADLLRKRSVEAGGLTPEQRVERARDIRAAEARLRVAGGSR